MEKGINEENINEKEISRDERNSKNIVKENWLNKHSSPSYGYLRQLAAEETPESEEELRQIGNDMDIDNYANVPLDQLIEKIRLADSFNEADENQHIRR